MGHQSSADEMEVALGATPRSGKHPLRYVSLVKLVYYALSLSLTMEEVIVSFAPVPAFGFGLMAELVRQVGSAVSVELHSMGERHVVPDFGRWR